MLSLSRRKFNNWLASTLISWRKTWIWLGCRECVLMIRLLARGPRHYWRNTIRIKWMISRGRRHFRSWRVWMRRMRRGLDSSVIYSLQKVLPLLWCSAFDAVSPIFHHPHDNPITFIHNRPSHIRLLDHDCAIPSVPSIPSIAPIDNHILHNTSVCVSASEVAWRVVASAIVWSWVAAVSGIAAGVAGGVVAGTHFYYRRN